MSEPINERPFRFAGVELGPGDKVQDKLRGLARGDLLKNSIRSILIGTVFALLLLYAEKFLRDPDIEYLSPLPDPYPYVSHGLPWFLIFFYIGWALYWGVFDCLNAEIMDEEHGANRVIGRLGNFTGRALPWMSVMAGSAPSRGWQPTESSRSRFVSSFSTAFSAAGFMHSISCCAKAGNPRHKARMSRAKTGTIVYGS